jgi:uncharacterized membrane protein
MRGPIDYIVVQFKGNNFKGEILEELIKAADSGAIAVLDLAVITRDTDGNVVSAELASMDDPVVKKIVGARSGDSLITDEDVAEIGELLDDDSAAGLLIVEQLWAKGLKQAILNANGTLLAEGRIHPEAAKELDQKEDK